MVADGTRLELNCSVTRIKPEATDIYWTLGEQRYNGTVNTTLNNDGTFSQQCVTVLKQVVLQYL